MGFVALRMTHSSRLEATIERVHQQHEDADDWLEECVDHTSTGGYDNDGSTGPELVDAGVGLGLQAAHHGPGAKVFYAFFGDVCYYQVGVDEDEAISRFETAAKAQADVANKPVTRQFEAIFQFDSTDAEADELELKVKELVEKALSLEHVAVIWE
jgi:hypothetical protein